jgi:hypothetical protein
MNPNMSRNIGLKKKQPFSWVANFGKLNYYGKTYIVCALSSAPLLLAAVDYDFTGRTPIASGQVPMIELNNTLKIGENLNGRSLCFDGKSKPAVMYDTGKFNAVKGLTIVLDVTFSNKGGKELHLLLLKSGEWLLGRTDNQLYFNLRCNGKWQKGCKIKVDFTSPIKMLLVYAPDKTLTLWLNGVLLKTEKLNWPAPDGGNDNLQLGGGWGEVWNAKCEISRLKIIPQAWSNQTCKEFFK